MPLHVLAYCPRHFYGDESLTIAMFVHGRTGGNGGPGELWKRGGMVKVDHQWPKAGLNLGPGLPCGDDAEAPCGFKGCMGICRRGTGKRVGKPDLLLFVVEGATASHGTSLDLR